MGSESTGNAGSTFRSRMEYYMYSGDKKHVFVGMAIIGVVFGVPWYFMTRGTKQRSHQDYMEKADRARSERLSSSPSSVKGS
ncbi:uncharacterized protein LOC131256948 [Magnolia sinica]|uniref:uncharacterized protein LOC131256948 n=1 Tax=Magnolia sinica TaxID=86752 RepID=UPI00265B5228|nr:uncharacterized protein LOC131256948 [Magnolia sinica]